MAKQRKDANIPTPQQGWAVYLRTSSEDNQKPELSRARQRIIIEGNVLNHSDMPVIDEYIDVLTGKTPKRAGYQRLLADAREGKFSHVIVERADRFGRNDTEALRAIDELNEFRVAVRFANSPDLDPMDPDDRVIVALSFTLARRESALLGIRTRGGQQAKRKSGGHTHYAPEGYVNVTARTDETKRHELGRFHTWIEQDPTRAGIWRFAWDLLLEDNWTLEEIAEKLHEQGHRHRTGRPFIQINSNGQRKANVSTISNVFHNWLYAGWVVSEKNLIPPKTIRGNWEPIVSTEEFERGLEILGYRNRHRIAKRRHDYLLKGLIYYIQNNGNQVKLTGSTSNTYRRGGGTAYYCIPRSNVNFKCDLVEQQVAIQLMDIQIDPNLMPLIRTHYTRDLAEKLGYQTSNEREKLEAALDAIDKEEIRTVRLFAAAKISEDVWDALWAEWQDKRTRLRIALDSVSQEQTYHIENLDSALQIVAKVGTLYNDLDRNAQKELLHHMVNRVIVNAEGRIALELRAPFAYLRNLLDEAQREYGTASTNKTSSINTDAGCSDWFQSVWGTWIRTKINGSKVRCPAIGRFPNMVVIVA